MDPEAARLERQHVHQVYETTAPYFSDLQSKAWPRVRQFLQDQKPGSLIADIVIHHFSTKQRRIRAIKEMARVLVPGGQMMIYVWAMEQKNRHFEKQDVLVPWNRALCGRLPSESSQSGKQAPHWHPASSERSCAGCFRERCTSKRSHSVDGGPAVPAACCGNISKQGSEENGFYNNLGKSFRSWFFSRSLDESTLRKQLERVRPSIQDGWATSTVSRQPSRHPSLDFDPQDQFPAKESNLDEEVFMDTSSQRHLNWPGAPITSKNVNGDQGGESGRSQAQNFPEGAISRGPCVDAGNLGDPSAGKTPRVSALGSTDSNPEDAVSAEHRADPVDPVDPRAFMRYYHVFREGELCSLLSESVSEMRILSAWNDHGNWCVIAEKKQSWD
ncbi:probable tRNA methyltransferase 9B isoform X2 [Nannospalax galili]|uniref:probable tRNA methyltransferase 9B isoform X2 n=1 Tax=Nannospalax galili TaxID=1026970 RepID=UPI0004ED0D1D|nr:probable tRNA methyltransferase 9B isoform X2 [Nannospalax galili]